MRTTIPNLLLFTLLMCSCLLAKAQLQEPEDRLIYNFSYGKTQPKNGTGDFVSNDIKMAFPIKSGKSTFTIGPDLGVLNITNTHNLLDTPSLKTIGVSFGFRTRLGQKNLFSASAEPLISSDFHDISGEDFRFRSTVLFLFPTSAKFALGFGLGYQYQFTGSQLLPIVTAIFNLGDKFTLGGALPLAPHLGYKVSQKFSLGFGLKGDYDSYRLSSALYQSRYVQYRNFSFGFDGKYKPTKHLEFGGFLGYGSRTLSIYNKDQTVPLRIFDLNIGGGSYKPYIVQKFNGAAINFNMAYRF